MVWIYASRDGRYDDDRLLWSRYEYTCIPRCDLCSKPIVDPSQRIHEDSGNQVRYQLIFCSPACQQEWHDDEDDQEEEIE